MTEKAVPLSRDYVVHLIKLGYSKIEICKLCDLTLPILKALFSVEYGFIRKQKEEEAAETRAIFL